jgi:hypothetical protein
MGALSMHTARGFNSSLSRVAKLSNTLWAPTFDKMWVQTARVAEEALLGRREHCNVMSGENGWMLKKTTQIKQMVSACRSHKNWPERKRGLSLSKQARVTFADEHRCLVTKESWNVFDCWEEGVPCGGPETGPLPEEGGEWLGQPFASNPMIPAYMSPPQNSGVLAIALDASLQAGGTGLALHWIAGFVLE